MKTGPLCPYCSTPIVASDVRTFEIERIATESADAPTHFWAVSCKYCQKLLGILPSVPEVKKTRKA
jgi:hypothetical protein